eukprot:UN33766
MNRITAQVLSNLTCGIRFSDVGLNHSLTKLQSNLVPVSRLHFLISSLSPLIPINTNKNMQIQIF